MDMTTREKKEILLKYRSTMREIEWLEREIQKSILADFKRKKVIVLLGARQAGKTTLLLSLALLRLIWQMKSMNRLLGV